MARSSPAEGVFLPPLPDGFFGRPNMSGFDVAARIVEQVPITGELMASITKARFVACQLTALPRGLTAYDAITSLVLTDNRLSGFGEGELSAFCELANIDLSSNALRALPRDTPRSIQTLDLSFNAGFDVRTLWALDLPELSVLRLSCCGIKKLPKTLPKWGNSVREINLSGNRIKTIPMVFAEFANLEKVNLFGNCVKRCTELSACRCSKSLDLSLNDLHDFDSDGSLNNIQVLIMNNNMLKKFPQKILELTSVKAIALNRCGICGILDFECPECLLSFEAGRNKINGVSQSFVSSTKNLSVLNLEHNLIEEIPDFFPDNNNLTHVMLDNNKIRKLPKSLLNSQCVETFSCKHNLIAKIEPFNFKKLKFLDLSFNRIQFLPDCFEEMESLYEVNISFNLIDKIPASFSYCRKMTSFFAAANQLRCFPKVIFSFYQLKTLSLSFNLISTIPSSICALRFLKFFDISNNHIKTIPKLAFLHQLSYVSFSHNIISDIDTECFPDDLILLDLSYNKLSKFNLVFQKLQSLNLDFNHLTSFDFNLTPTIKYLSLSMNDIDQNIMETLYEISKNSNINCFEYIGNKYSIKNKIEPLRFHFLSNNDITFSKKYGVGYASTMGERLSMEDSVLIRKIDKSTSLFGIFDGHSGNVSSTTASHCLYNEIKKIQKKENFKEEFSNVFVKINQILKSINTPDGCTAAVACIIKKTCYVIGVGDSRIVKVTNKATKRITKDFKPLDRLEFKRLRDNNLDVSQEGRVQRKLAISRSLGDFWCGDGLFVKPKTSSFKILNNVHSIIIACDGLWDVIDDDYAGRIVRNSKSATEAAVTLKNQAYALGSKDNISVIVIFFHPEKGTEGIINKNEIEELEDIEEEVNYDPPQKHMYVRRRK